MAECNSQQFFMTATPYSKFTLSQLEARYGVSFVRGAFLAGVSPLPVPDWLKTYLELSSDIPSALKSEKAISEQTIAPVMLAVRDRNRQKISVFSGEMLTHQDLSGYCDFIVTANPVSLVPESPFIIVVEAKQQDLTSGIPQCVAEMIAARRLNEAAGLQQDALFGCVTIGSEWLFLQYRDAEVMMHSRVYYLNEVGEILGVFQWMIDAVKNTKEYTTS